MSNIFVPTPITEMRDVFTFTEDMVVLVDGFANSPAPFLKEDVKEAFDDLGCDAFVTKSGTKTVDGVEKPAYSMSIVNRHTDPTGMRPIDIYEDESLALGGRWMFERVDL